MFRGREPEYFHSCSVKIHPKRHFSFSVPRSSIRRSGNFGDYSCGQGSHLCSVWLEGWLGMEPFHPKIYSVWLKNC